MIREKYQYSGFTSIIGSAVVPAAPTYTARFVKKEFGGDPIEARYAKRGQREERALYADPSIPTAQVFIARGRHHDAERDHIKRYQRGDYDGDFPTGGRDQSGGGGGLENILKVLRAGGQAKQRRKSFVFHRHLPQEVLFDDHQEPIFDVAFGEGLDEDQSRAILRDMERRHRRKRETEELWDRQRRVHEAEEQARLRREAENDELRRLKEKLRKHNTALDHFKEDARAAEDFAGRVADLRRQLDGGAGDRGDSLGDEFMDPDGVPHNGLVDDYNAHSAGGRGQKLRLYKALHFAGTDQADGGSLRPALDCHFKCPCCGLHANPATHTHDPAHVHRPALVTETTCGRKKDAFAALGPTRDAATMIAFSEATKTLQIALDDAEAARRERDVFKIPPAPPEAPARSMALADTAAGITRRRMRLAELLPSTVPHGIAVTSGMSLAKSKASPPALVAAPFREAAAPQPRPAAIGAALIAALLEEEGQADGSAKRAASTSTANIAAAAARPQQGPSRYENKAALLAPSGPAAAPAAAPQLRPSAEGARGGPMIVVTSQSATPNTGTSTATSPAPIQRVPVAGPPPAGVVAGVRGLEVLATGTTGLKGTLGRPGRGRTVVLSLT